MKPHYPGGRVCLNGRVYTSVLTQGQACIYTRAMSRTETAIRTQVPVTFRKGTKYAITYGPGSIFTDWTPAAEGDDLTISRGSKHTATISMDDATPVEWDDLDETWIDA